MPGGRDYFQCPVVVVAKMAMEDMRGALKVLLRMRSTSSAHDQLLVLPHLRMLFQLINCSHQVAHAALVLDLDLLIAMSSSLISFLCPYGLSALYPSIGIQSM